MHGITPFPVICLPQSLVLNIIQMSAVALPQVKFIFSLDGPNDFKAYMGLGCSSVEEYLPSMGKALGSPPISAKEEEKI